MTHSVPACKRYLYDTVLPELFPGVQVFYSLPGTFEEADMILLGGAVSTSELPVMGSSHRVEDLIEQTIVISCFRRGGPEAQIEATESAYEYFEALRDHFRTSTKETLGGNCIWARITGHELVEDEDPEDTEDGRLSQVTVTITIRARQ